LFSHVGEAKERNWNGILLNQSFVASAQLLIAFSPLCRVGQNVAFDSVVIRIFRSQLAGIFCGCKHRYMADVSLCIQRRSNSAEIFDIQRKPNLVVCIKLADSEFSNSIHFAFPIAEARPVTAKNSPKALWVRVLIIRWHFCTIIRAHSTLF